MYPSIFLFSYSFWIFTDRISILIVIIGWCALVITVVFSYEPAISFLPVIFYSSNFFVLLRFVPENVLNCVPVYRKWNNKIFLVCFEMLSFTAVSNSSSSSRCKVFFILSILTFDIHNNTMIQLVFPIPSPWRH